MRRINIFMVAVCAVVVLMGCSMGVSRSISNGKDSDATVKKDIKISPFTRISATSGIRIIFTQGKSTGVAHVATTPSAEPYLDITVNDGELMATYKNIAKSIKGPTIITVSAPELEGVTLTSAADLTVNGDLSLKRDLELELTSASSADFNRIACMGIDICVTSAASVNAKGVDCKKFESSVTSASSLSVANITASYVGTEATSGASVELKAVKGNKVLAEATSGASVTVEGIDAVTVQSYASSGGKVTVAGRCASCDREASSGGWVDLSRLTIDGKRPAVKSGGGSGLRIP